MSGTYGPTETFTEALARARGACICGAAEDPDQETICTCAEQAKAAEEEVAAYDPREDEECTPELIDGTYYGCGACEACRP